MEELLNELLDESETGERALQMIVGGNMIAGAVRRSEREGMVELGTVGMDQQRRQVLITILVKISSIDAIYVPQETSSIEQPKKGLVIPRG